MPEISISGIKTNYEIFGEGAPLLVLHGWGSNIERWQETAQALATRGIKVFLVDLPGFGKSEILREPWNLNKYVSFAEAFIKELKLKDFYLLGHSFGGALACKLAIRNAQIVKKLFLVSAACVRDTAAPKKKAFFAISKIIGFFRFLPFFRFFRKAVYKFIIKKSDYLSVEGMMKQTYLNVISENILYHLSAIKIPAVIIWGDKDDLTPVRNARLINQKIRNSRLVIITGAGHALNREKPGELAEKILQNI